MDTLSLQDWTTHNHHHHRTGNGSACGWGTLHSYVTGGYRIIQAGWDSLTTSYARGLLRMVLGWLVCPLTWGRIRFQFLEQCLCSLEAAVIQGHTETHLAQNPTSYYTSGCKNNATLFGLPMVPIHYISSPFV